MQEAKWVHIPFRRGLEIVGQHDPDFGIPERPGLTLSAWGLVLSNDGFVENARIAGVLFVERSDSEKRIGIRIGWIERSSDTRGRKSRMVADFVMLALARWIDARWFFLCGPRGDGVALTREAANQERQVLEWTMGRMRSIPRVRTRNPVPSMFSVPVERSSVQDVCYA